MAGMFGGSGGRPLKGAVRPAGNKSAALPTLGAPLLADGPCRIDNVPHIRDVETMLALLAGLGAAGRPAGAHTAAGARRAPGATPATQQSRMAAFFLTEQYYAPAPSAASTAGSRRD